MEIRKIVLVKETVMGEAGRAAAQPVTRAAGLVAVVNPFVGRYEEDLTPLFELGYQIGERVMPQVAALLEGPAVAYGKAAIVGAFGEVEHGSAVIHPKLGQPLRAAVGGGEAIIASNAKVAAPGTAIDVPLAHKDNIWSFDHLDTMTLSVADSPRPDEILVIMALSDGGRPHPRSGKGPIKN